MIIQVRIPQTEIDAYYASPNLSQSLLKATRYGVRAFENAVARIRNTGPLMYYEEPSDAFIIGSAADCMLTQSVEDFEAKYYVADESISKPSDAIMSIIKAVFDAVIAEEGELGTLSEHREKILQAVESHNWNRTWSDDVKFNKIWTSGASYWTLLVESRGKTILTLDEYTKAKNAAESILSSSEYNALFDSNNTLLVIYQLPVYGNMYGHRTKALIDMVVIDFRHESVSLYDFKTMSGHVYDFIHSMRKFRYDIQGAWYNAQFERVFGGESIKYLAEYLAPFMPEEEPSQLMLNRMSNGFTPSLKNFSFFVASTTNYSEAVKYVMNDGLMRIAKEGREETFYESFGPTSGQMQIHCHAQILGIEQLMDFYTAYTETSDAKDHLAKGRQLILDWDCFNMSE